MNHYRFRLIFGIILTFSFFAMTMVLKADRPGNTLKGTFDIKVGQVVDRNTEKQLLNADVKLINTDNDSLLVEKKAYTSWYSGWYNGNTGQKTESSMFNIMDIPFAGSYLLKVSYPGYEDSETFFDGKDIADKKEYYISFPYIYLDRKAKELDELNVTATKLKFYNRGDTIVYNADAFVMAEGSMLDDLIRQLPGVELKENGQIFVNGEFVESLMLNGKDFFKGNRELMLKNLSAYVVKNIEVYERQQDIDKVMGKDFGRKLLTMDVKLKKDYHHGFMGNVEAGYGTSGRYLGRLLAMWHSDHARVSVIGNVNNLNESRKPGMESTFQPETMNRGTLKTYMGGTEYDVESKKSGWGVNGNVTFERTVLHDGSRTFTTNFIPGGDTYARSFATRQDKAMKVSTSHSIRLNKPTYYIGFFPEFEYSKGRFTGSQTDATFNTDVQTGTPDMIRDIFSDAWSLEASSLLNRYLEESLSKNHSFKAGGFSNGRFRLNKGHQSLTYLLSGKYYEVHRDVFNRFGINYGNNPVFAEATDRFIHDFPQWNMNLTGAVGYQIMPVKGLSLDIFYEYVHEKDRSYSDLYSLDKIYNGFGPGQIGTLPSLREYESTLDPSLSYDSRITTDRHTLSPNMTWNISNSSVTLHIEAPLMVERRHIDYYRGGIDHTLSQTRFRPGNMMTEVKFNYTRDWKGNFLYRLYSKAPDMIYMVDLSDERNPLNVTLGNPELRTAYTHDLSFSSSCNKNGRSQFYRLSYTRDDNMVSAATNYNTLTGARTTRIVNVNGNWHAAASQSFYTEFGNLNRFYFNNDTYIPFTRSVDFTSRDNGELSKNIVNSYGFSEAVRLGYIRNGSKIGIFTNVNLSHYESKMTGFDAFNAWTVSYGARAIWRLPANFQIATDFTIYSRRGYSDRQLNTDNFIWNAKLSYSVPRTGLTLMAEGFDILHNLSDVTLNVNAQGRTERYVNVLPRYFLFHVQWMFNTLDKKR